MTVVSDISIGPVQGFVAQSRRTRDLGEARTCLRFWPRTRWGAQQAGGVIVQPLVANDPLFRWVSGERTGQAPPIGSLPNHFKVQVDGDAEAVAAASVKAFRSAWDRVCEAVWNHFVAPAEAFGDNTRQIWERQVRAFWEVTWIVGHADERGCLHGASTGALIGCRTNRVTSALSCTICRSCPGMYAQQAGKPVWHMTNSGAACGRYGPARSTRR